MQCGDRRARSAGGAPDDVDHLKAALAPVEVQDAFLTAASPGVVSLFFRNEHYLTEEAYLSAIADAMRHEYETIAEAGIILQIDCPDLGMGRYIEAANRRRAHEWRLFETVKLPEGKLLIPGVIESKSNFIEHPNLIAQRIGHDAQLVGRENVIAGSDCGFGTWVGQAAVDPDVVWAKLAAMADGARIASREFLKH